MIVYNYNPNNAQCAIRESDSQQGSQVPHAPRRPLRNSTHPHTQKRTNVSQWTSNPLFESLEIDESTENIELKLCEATSDRKLKIVGTASLKVDAATDKEIVFEGEVKLEQQVEGECICVGIAYVTVAKEVQF